MITAAAVWQMLSALRTAKPLVHNITNFVAMNNTANALLAVGASPAMVHACEEVEEFVPLARSLVVNIGTLSPPWVAAMRLAVARARAADRPWALDPVGAGATSYRTGAATALIRMRPAVIRGNASEVLALAGAGTEPTRGVDAAHDSDAALDAARRLADETGAVVAVTGAIDYVTDGERLLALSNGHPLMARVTGLGCTATALAGAFLAVEPDPFRAAAGAIAVLGIAGELAAEQAEGPGSLQVALLDALHALDQAAIERRGRWQ